MVAHRYESEKIPSSNKVGFICRVRERAIDESITMSVRNSKMLLRPGCRIEQEKCKIEWKEAMD